MIARLVCTMSKNYAYSISNDKSSSRAELVEAVALWEGIVRSRRRVYGDPHPCTLRVRKNLENTRQTLDARDKTPR